MASLDELKIVMEGSVQKSGEKSLVTLEQELKSHLAGIKPLDLAAMEHCQKRWDSIAKPLNSLGKMESTMVQIAGMIAGSDVRLGKRALVIMCADNGVAEEGVTQTGQEVTAIVSENFREENPNMTSAKLMAIKTGTKIIPVDIGVAVDTSIINCKIAYSTNNMCKGPAMTRQQAARALLCGIDIVGILKEQGYQILGTGEMGIGNTTTSSAMASVLLDVPVESVTGRGAGLSSEGLAKKVDAIHRAITLNQPNPQDAIDVLLKVGGYDIAGLAGVFLGGAIHRIPIVIDGFISSVAALTARKIYQNFLQEINKCEISGKGTDKNVGKNAGKDVGNNVSTDLENQSDKSGQCFADIMDFAIASHVSKEPAGHMLLEALGKEAMLTCDMCLGEGTGALAVLPIMDLAEDIYEKMSTFADIKVEDYQPFED